MVLFINYDYGWVFNWDSNHPWTNELYKNGISEAFLFGDKLFCSELWTYEIDPPNIWSSPSFLGLFFPSRNPPFSHGILPASVIWSLSNTLAIWMAECPCKDPTSTMKRGMPSIYKMSSVCFSRNRDATWEPLNDLFVKHLCWREHLFQVYDCNQINALSMLVITSNPSHEENSNLRLHSLTSSAPTENQHDFTGIPWCRKLARLNQSTHQNQQQKDSRESIVTQQSESFYITNYNDHSVSVRSDFFWRNFANQGSKISVKNSGNKLEWG